MSLKSGGSVGVANVQGPVTLGAENQRPATRKKIGPVSPSLKTSLSVLLTQRSFVPLTGVYFGAPATRISSAGVVLVYTTGRISGGMGLPGSAAFTAFQLSSSGSLLNASGSLSARFHGPPTASAVSQYSFTRRK